MEEDIAFTPPTLETLQELLPNYTVTAFLAQGGMGAVYEAFQTSLDRYVAIKILPPELSADTSFRTQFTTEARAMAKLNHPNLISVYDFGDAGGMLYLVMELVDGGDLYYSTYDQMVEQTVAAQMIANLGHGLNHAHEMGLIHRDIKPANILLDEQANPKIGDFGLARSLEDGAEQGDIFGTPGYTAPEVLANPTAVDQRADVYSLGVVLYELLTNQLPPQPFKPASMICGCDRGFDKILARTLHSSPQMRYTSASEFARDIEILLAQGLRSVAITPSTRTSPTRPIAAVNPQQLGARRPVKQLVSAKSSNTGVYIIIVMLLIIAGLYFAWKGGHLG